MYAHLQTQICIQLNEEKKKNKINCTINLARQLRMKTLQFFKGEQLRQLDAQCDAV